MTPTRGQQLQQAREEAGLTLPELSEKTNIPLGHLRALEADELHALPEGVYVQAYLRTLEDLFGLRISQTDTETMPEVGQALRRTRAVASASVFLLVLAASAVAFQSLPDKPETGADVANSSGLHVKVHANDEGTLRAWVDGKLVVDQSYTKPTSETKNASKDEGDATTSRQIELQGDYNVTIEATPVGAFRYYRDGERLKPVGRQSDRRTLVFTKTRKESS